MKTIPEYLSEARPAQLIQAMIGIIKGNFFTKRIEVKQTSDGMVGIYRAEDGNLYTIQISAIADSEYKSLFKEYTAKK